MPKKNGDTDGFKMLVLIDESAIKIPKRYAPPSPKKIFAFGKLNVIKSKVIKLIKNNIYIIL